MSDRIPIDRPVIVEGKYDKIRLSSVIDAEILTTDGFRIFRETEKAALICRLAEKKGVIVLTDSDGGGLVIRNYFRSVLPKDKLIHLYIPPVPGRERRKTADSREGLLGVEGMETETLRALFLPFAADAGREPAEKTPVTVTDFYEDGLSGRPGSREKRAALCRRCGLPLQLSSSALLAAMNLLYGKEVYRDLIREIGTGTENHHENG